MTNRQMHERRYDVRQQAEVPGAGQHHSAASSELAASGASAAFSQGKLRGHTFSQSWAAPVRRIGYMMQIVYSIKFLPELEQKLTFVWSARISLQSFMIMPFCFGNQIAEPFQVQAQEDLKQIKRLKLKVIRINNICLQIADKVKVKKISKKTKTRQNLKSKSKYIFLKNAKAISSGSSL